MRPVRVGIIGAGFGERVLAPAFLRAGADVAAMAARDWRRIIDDPSIEAVAIAVPPSAQPPIALAALKRGKSVFAEKPLATTVAAARRLERAARGRTTAVDFELSEIPAWKKAESILRSGKLGRLRHVSLTWHIEILANKNKIHSWKTRSRDGGGVLFAFASHSFNYLERFCGPIRAISARLHSAPELPGPQETLLTFAAGCHGGTAIEGSICSHAFLGGGHKLAFYGGKGTLVLENKTDDYGKGFQLFLGTRADQKLKPVFVARSRAFTEDGRIAPVASLARRFLASCRSKRAISPGFREGLRVQVLLEACRRSHRLRRRVPA